MFIGFPMVAVPARATRSEQRIRSVVRGKRSAQGLVEMSSLRTPDLRRQLGTLMGTLVFLAPWNR
ncbi:hypothetical protein YW7DRAFT_03780 [Streptomyces sp. AmelKG-E11A]|nr:hypothetical protein YW7DRAFT_03780 [Streptomyces sp. AmelKG-E11A]